MVKLQVNGQTQSFCGDPSIPLLSVDFFSLTRARARETKKTQHIAAVFVHQPQEPIS
jgi:hypothetical protein